MTRNSVWMLAAALGTSAGCLTTGPGGFSGGGDGDIDADADADADSDADSDGDTGSGTGTECPPYPDGDSGYQIGQVVPDFAMPGGNGAEDGQWSMNQVWCMANRAENPPTVLLINVHSLT